MAKSEKIWLNPFVSREFYLRAPDSIPGVISAVAYNSDRCSFDLFQQLDIKAPDRIVKSLSKRQADYLAGRLAAKNAMLKCLKGAKSRIVAQVSAADSRMPVFPQGFVGSISHTNNMAVAAVANCEAMESIGIDLEHLITEESYDVIKRQILTEAELLLMPKFPIPNNEALTVIFSAKESLYKLLYPMVKQFFDFSAAKVIIIESGKGSWSRFTIQLIDSLNECLSQGLTFQGYYQKYGECIVTLIGLHHKSLVSGS